MINMNCDEIRHKLSLLIDGQLSKAEQQAAENHLVECPDCREYYQKLVRLGEKADDLVLSQPEQYWEKQKDAVLDKMNQAESEKITEVKPERNRNLIYRFIAVAASIALVAFVSIYESKDIEPTRSLFSDKEFRDITAPSVADTMKESLTEAKKLARPAEPVSRERPAAKEEPQDVSELRKPVVDRKSAVEDKARAGVPEPVPQTVDRKAVETAHMTAREEQEAGELEADAVAEPDKFEEGTLEISPEPVGTVDKSAQPDKVFTESLGKGIGLPQESRQALDFAPSPGMTSAATAGSEQSDTTYKFWRTRLDSLEEIHREIFSPHYLESRAKSKKELPGDSLDAVILEMAETSYQVGLHTSDEQERDLMINHLRRLAYAGSPEVVEKVHNYIALLMSSR